MNPNHYLAVAIRYLLTHRPQWREEVAVGKTLVSSSMIDRVVQKLGRELREVPVGFKWFVPGLFDGSYCFGGEESAGASFLRLDGTVWTTDKDGPIMDLLAAEITARTGKDPGEHYRELTAEFGTPYYTRIDAPATPEQKSKIAETLARCGKRVRSGGRANHRQADRAPGNHAPIGGLKVVAKSGWFAARPSGTENIYKIYAESFKSQTHLNAIVSEAQEMVNNALRSSGAVMGRTAGWRMFHRFRPNTALPACCCTLRLCHRLMGSAILGRLRFPGSTDSTTLGKAGGRRCHLGRPVTEILLTNHCLRLRAMAC